jgi:hypothetical protein
MNRKFGIEIEAYGVAMSQVAAALNQAGIACNVEGYNHQTRTSWKVVTDGSLTGGLTFELVSPILQGVDGLMQVQKVGEILNRLGAKVNKSCGLHVHIDARDLNTAKLKNVCKMWMKYESCFDSIVPESRRDNLFCRGIRNKFASLDAAFNAIDGAQTSAGLCKVVNGDGIYTSRYHKLNLESLMRHGTLEFRQHSGTVDGDKMANWVMLVGGFVECAVNAKTIRKTGEGKFENLMAVTPIPQVKKFYIERRAALMA